MRVSPVRRPVDLVALTLMGLLAGLTLVAARAEATGPLEKSEVIVAIAAPSATYLPTYLALEETARAEGLTLRLAMIGGGPQTAAALASGSVDVAVTALNIVVNMISAGQLVKVFYAASSQAEFEWFARDPAKRWQDLQGKTVAVSAPGSLTDGLTRRVLSKHGVRPGVSVALVSSGATATRFAALKAGRVDAAILLPPFTWSAEAQGFTRLGTQASEIAPTWPRTVFAARERFLADHPATVRALLRAHVRALRLGRANPELAIKLLGKHVRDEVQYHERAYREVMPAFDERGRLPAATMPLFWELAIEAGEVTEAWPESRFLDSRFIDSFEAWAPDPARP
jgi:NitT/TauT family transport system substrate-binding protein